MPKTMNQEERQLVKLIEKMPLPDEEKSAWMDQIRSGDMSEELAETMRQKLSTPVEGDDQAARRARYLVDLANLVRRWRLTSQSRNFGRR